MATKLYIYPVYSTAAGAKWIPITGIQSGVARDESKFFDVQWVAQCTREPRQQWPHADLLSLEEAALELWNVDWLRQMSPSEAAALWLHPLRPG